MLGMAKNKINKLLIGTNNKGKLREIRDLLPKRIKIYSTSDFNLKSPKENGTSFKTNSLIKSKFFSKKTKLFCLADDSGLEIDILKKKPGIYSARWAKKYGNFYKAMKFILKLMKNKKNRTATFVCSLSYKSRFGIKATVIGKIKGTISNKIIGKKGFGYDPIFIPYGEKQTFGQMSKSKKIRMDHRFIAFKKLKKKIKIL